MKQFEALKPIYYKAKTYKTENEKKKTKKLKKNQKNYFPFTLKTHTQAHTNIFRSSKDANWGH